MHKILALRYTLCLLDMLCSAVIAGLKDQLSKKQKEIDTLQGKIDLTLSSDGGEPLLR